MTFLAASNSLTEVIQNSFPQILEGFFGIVTNAFIVAALLVYLYFMFQLVLTANLKVERILRATSLATGLLIFFGARSLNISIAELMVSSATLTNPVAFGFFGVIMPAMMGTFLAWYFVGTIKRSSNIVIRSMILIGTFTVFQFIDVYLRALSIKGDTPVDKALVPNLCFIIAVALYTILRYDPEHPLPSVGIKNITKSLFAKVRNSANRNLYFYHTDNGQLGPYTVSEMIQLYSNDQISDNTPISKNGDGNKQPFRSMKEFLAVTK